ncbi:unnamed protein product [Caenorhabditis bovis]|uniref:Uncharacterized protein n=1 Tax=Caenorhabditis bovis TaxID=2654633 RepID=A0A8S1EIN6_9PELO|nr:unnamed protein product [Caenorhabditis bovis]
MPVRNALSATNGNGMNSSLAKKVDEPMDCDEVKNASVPMELDHTTVPDEGKPATAIKPIDLNSSYTTSVVAPEKQPALKTSNLPEGCITKLIEEKVEEWRETRPNEASDVAVAASALISLGECNSASSYEDDEWMEVDNPLWSDESDGGDIDYYNGSPDHDAMSDQNCSDNSKHDETSDSEKNKSDNTEEVDVREKEVNGKKRPFEVDDKYLQALCKADQGPPKAPLPNNQTSLTFPSRQSLRNAQKIAFSFVDHSKYPNLKWNPAPPPEKKSKVKMAQSKVEPWLESFDSLIQRLGADVERGNANAKNDKDNGAVRRFQGLPKKEERESAILKAALRCRPGMIRGPLQYGILNSNIGSSHSLRSCDYNVLHDHTYALPRSDHEVAYRCTIGDDEILGKEGDFDIPDLNDVGPQWENELSPIMADYIRNCFIYRNRRNTATTRKESTVKEPKKAVKLYDAYPKRKRDANGN